MKNVEVVATLAVDPRSSRTVYAGTSEGVFKSRNRGRRWRTANKGLQSNPVHTLAIDPRSPQTVYAGTPRGVFVSSDGGRNWRPLDQGLTAQVVTLAVAPGVGTVYAGTLGGRVVDFTAPPSRAG